jgi:hypothetical protein
MILELSQYAYIESFGNVQDVKLCTFDSTYYQRGQI